MLLTPSALHFSIVEYKRDPNSEVSWTGNVSASSSTDWKGRILKGNGLVNLLSSVPEEKCFLQYFDRLGRVANDVRLLVGTPEPTFATIFVNDFNIVSQNKSSFKGGGCCLWMRMQAILPRRGLLKTECSCSLFQARRTCQSACKIMHMICDLCERHYHLLKWVRTFWPIQYG